MAHEGVRYHTRRLVFGMASAQTKLQPCSSGLFYEASTRCGSTLRGTTRSLLIGASRRSNSTVPRALSHTREVRVGEQTLQQACSQEYPGSARCVQSFDDSLDSAIRITYRISLRSSSMWEPRHPSLKVVLNSVCPRRRSVLVAEFRPR